MGPAGLESLPFGPGGKRAGAFKAGPTRARRWRKVWVAGWLAGWLVRGESGGGGGGGGGKDLANRPDEGDAGVGGAAEGGLGHAQAGPRVGDEVLGVRRHGAAARGRVR